jgi:hypothetical protein
VDLDAFQRHEVPGHPLDAEVDRGHREASLPLGRNDIRRFGRHLARQVGPCHRRRGEHLGQQLGLARSSPRRR